MLLLIHYTAAQNKIHKAFSFAELSHNKFASFDYEEKRTCLMTMINFQQFSTIDRDLITDLILLQVIKASNLSFSTDRKDCEHYAVKAWLPMF